MKLAACVRDNVATVNGSDFDIAKFLKFPIDKFNKQPADDLGLKGSVARHRNFHLNRKAGSL
jgi:hypothetical protein